MCDHDGTCIGQSRLKNSKIVREVFCETCESVIMVFADVQEYRPNPKLELPTQEAA